MEGKDKQQQYAILMSKLKKAINNEFYYESIFIEYAVMEDRTESILKHANVKYLNKEGMPVSISVKINKLRSNAVFQDKYIKKHLTEKLLDDLVEWKEERNHLIHALIKHKYDEEKLKNIALRGECIAKKLASKSALVNKYLDSKKESL